MTFSVNPTADKTQAQFQQAAIAQNGTGTETPITGGETASTSVAAATETATEAATEVATATSVASDSAQATDGVSPGTGTVGADGSCSCFASCSAGSFPAVDAQGIGARGGVAGTCSYPYTLLHLSNTIRLAAHEHGRHLLKQRHIRSTYQPSIENRGLHRRATVDMTIFFFFQSRRCLEGETLLHGAWRYI